MHLISTRPQVVHLAGLKFAFESGEYITTEHSYKRSAQEFAHLADAAGFDVAQTWSDENNWFCVQFLMVRAGESTRPKRHSLPIAEIFPA